MEAEKPNGTILFFSPRQSNLPPFFPHGKLIAFHTGYLLVSVVHFELEKEKIIDFKGNPNPVGLPDQVR